MAYLSRVDDARTANGSNGWFKVYQNAWRHRPGSIDAAGDYWGGKDVDTCCGRFDIKIPSDILSGDYLLRPEKIGISGGGTQFYMNCFQLTVTDGGNVSPSTVPIPGVYQAGHPGFNAIEVGPYPLPTFTSYPVPGPTVYSGGSTKTPGSPCTGCEATCTPTTPVDWIEPEYQCPIPPGYACNGTFYQGECPGQCRGGVEECRVNVYFGKEPYCQWP